MADKRALRQGVRQLQRVKTWQLVVLLLLVLFIAATFLRLNNIGMIERRSAVLAADEAGNTEDMKRRLYDLQQYVSSHMNTDMGRGIYLEAQYNRDRQAAYDAAAAASSSGQNIYKQITDSCRAQFNAWAPYFQCVQDRLDTSAPAQDPSENLVLPRPESYRHVFVSPVWSADFAGLSVLVAGVLVVMILARLTGLAILRFLLKQHYKSI